MEFMTGTGCIPALRALGDESRLRIVRLLGRSALSVNEISEKLEVSQYNASKHLRILREAGLLECHKRGRLRLYSIPEKLRDDIETSVLDLGCCSFRLDQLPK
jgi:DNA-binding transcriptional ArsR family regulator